MSAAHRGQSRPHGPWEKPPDLFGMGLAQWPAKVAVMPYGLHHGYERNNQDWDGAKKEAEQVVYPQDVALWGNRTGCVCELIISSVAVVIDFVAVRHNSPTHAPTSPTSAEVSRHLGPAGLAAAGPGPQCGEGDNRVG